MIVWQVVRPENIPIKNLFAINVFHPVVNVHHRLYVQHAKLIIIIMLKLHNVFKIVL